MSEKKGNRLFMIGKQLKVTVFLLFAATALFFLAPLTAKAGEVADSAGASTVSDMTPDFPAFQDAGSYSVFKDQVRLLIQKDQIKMVSVYIIFSLFIFYYNCTNYSWMKSFALYVINKGAFTLLFVNLLIWFFRDGSFHITKTLITIMFFELIFELLLPLIIDIVYYRYCKYICSKEFGNDYDGEPFENVIPGNDALQFLLEKDKELWEELSDSLDEAQKQLILIRDLKEQLSRILIENGLSDLSYIGEALSQIEKDICRSLYICDDWMSIYDSEEEEEFEAMRNILNSSIIKNCEILMVSKEMIHIFSMYFKNKDSFSSEQLLKCLEKRATIAIDD